MTQTFDLKDRIEQRTREIEDIYKRELLNLSEGLKQHAANELSTISSDMEQEIKSIRGALEETKKIRLDLYQTASEIKADFEKVLNLNKAQNEQHLTELKAQSENFLTTVRTREKRRSWIFRIGMVLMTVAGIYGFSEFMGWKIARQWETMIEQGQKIKTLKAETEALEKEHIGIQTVGDRMFLKLPPGIKAKEGWKKDNRRFIELEEG